MRTLVIVALALGLLSATTGFLIAAGDSNADAIKKELEKLEGAWVTMSLELNGTKESEEEVKKADMKLAFKGNTVSLRQKDEVVFEATFKIDPAKKPKTLDLTITKGQSDGTKSLAIYELDGDTLRACWTLFAVERDRPTEFATKADAGLLLVVYKREKK